MKKESRACGERRTSASQPQDVQVQHRSVDDSFSNNVSQQWWGACAQSWVDHTHIRHGMMNANTHLHLGFTSLCVVYVSVKQKSKWWDIWNGRSNVVMMEVTITYSSKKNSTRLEGGIDHHTIGVVQINVCFIFAPLLQRILFKCMFYLRSFTTMNIWPLVTELLWVKKTSRTPASYIIMHECIKLGAWDRSMPAQNSHKKQ